jgi:hypothetical protein
MTIAGIEFKNGAKAWMISLEPEQAARLEEYAKTYTPKGRSPSGMSLISAFLEPIINPPGLIDPEFHVGDAVRAKSKATEGTVIEVHQTSNRNWQYTVENTWGTRSVWGDGKLERLA